MSHLTAACEYLSIDETAVLSHRVTDDAVVVVVDRGIKGCPKYTIPLSELVSDEPKEVPTSELKEMARDMGIKGYSRMKRETLIERLGL